MTNVTWNTCDGGKQWCPLDWLNLQPLDDVDGVYIIWHAGNPGRVVRLGQGNIAERLAKHRTDPAIGAYRQLGTLYVTWAALPDALMDGVERYLANQLHPLVGDAFPVAPPMAVNLPW